MSDFNYSDFLKSGPTKQYNSYMNDRYIELNGMTIYVFKLDKVLTKKSELYGSEEKSRIYLPHFPIRALYNSSKWSGGLTLNIYEENEEDTAFTVNFDRMVNYHRQLKNKTSGTIKLEYSGAGNPFIKISNNILQLSIDNNNSITIDLTNQEFNTVRKVVNKINTVRGFSCSFEGENENSKNIQNIDRINFKGSTKEILVNDNTYSNITDVIEMGDVILTDKYKLYQVTSARPAGDIGWNYSTYLISGTACDLSLVDSLPNDYRQIINKNQLGLGKIKKE